MTVVDEDGDEAQPSCDRPEMLRVRLTVDEKNALEQAREASRLINGGKRMSRSHLVRTGLAKVCRDISIRAKKAQATG